MALRQEPAQRLTCKQEKAEVPRSSLTCNQKKISDARILEQRNKERSQEKESDRVCFAGKLRHAPRPRRHFVEL